MNWRFLNIVDSISVDRMQQNVLLTLGTSSNFLQQDGTPPLRRENKFTQQNENSQNGTLQKSCEYIKNHDWTRIWIVSWGANLEKKEKNVLHSIWFVHFNLYWIHIETKS